MEDEQNCYNNNSENFTIAIIRTASSLVSFLICLLVAAIIILLKRCILFNQRIALYFCVAAMAQAVGVLVAASFTFLDKESQSTDLCVCLGFFTQATSTMLAAANLVIVVDMYIRVVWQKNTAGYEIQYILIIFLLPILISGLPFIENSYGQDGPWCWIRTVNNDSNCTAHVIGTVFQISLGYVPVAITAIIVAITYALLVRHLHRNRYTGKFDPQKANEHKRMLKEVAPFLAYPWIFLIISLTIIIVKFVIPGIADTSLKIILAVITPFAGALGAVVFGIDVETIQRLCKAGTYMCRKDKIVEYPALINADTDSVTESGTHSHHYVV